MAARKVLPTALCTLPQRLAEVTSSRVSLVSHQKRADMMEVMMVMMMMMTVPNRRSQPKPCFAMVCAEIGRDLEN